MPFGLVIFCFIPIGGHICFHILKIQSTNVNVKMPDSGCKLLL